MILVYHESVSPDLAWMKSESEPEIRTQVDVANLRVGEDLTGCAGG